ncbi:MAG TPA: diphthine--ammonia ligase [Actinopolymorphaceae bacterium]
MTALEGMPVFGSWSGGKDSTLALYEASLAGAEPRLLLTMMTEDSTRSRSHGLRREVLQAQADALGLPIRFGSASWSGYTAEFERLVAHAGSLGISDGVFGDIDLEDHRTWVETVCRTANARAHLPLWKRERTAVVEQVRAAGFRAVIVAVQDGVLPAELLGRVLDEDTVDVIRRAGADPAGEHGEYHTVVVDGPLFTRPVAVTPGETVLRDGVWFLDLALAQDPRPVTAG